MKRYLAILMVAVMIVSCLAFPACDSETNVGATTVKKTSHLHSRGTASCISKAVCKDCGKEYGELAVHSFGEDGMCTVCKAKNPSDEEAAAAVIEVIKALESFKNITPGNYSDAKEKYLAAKAAFDGLNNIAKSFVDANTKKTLTGFKALIAAYEEDLKNNDPLAYYYLKLSELPKINTCKATVDLDGELDEEILEKCTPMTLTKELCEEWSNGSASNGAGLVGDVSMAKDANTKVSFYIVYDNEYLYVIEQRSDLTWNFSANDHTQSYTGDGSLIWFVNTDDASQWIASGGVETADSPACGLMWSAGTNGQKPGETIPKVAYFSEDDQTRTEEKLAFEVWQSAIKWDAQKSTYVLEVAIPWSDLPFSAEDIEAGNISATFCSVDIVASDFDGNKNLLWSNIGYQMQYPGVNNWCWSQPLETKK